MTSSWNEKKLYAEAKDAMLEGSWAKAIEYFEKIETRFPYGRYAQQAQLETCYTHFKAGENALALAACDRFIKLYPNHTHIDYVYYLKGLVNFNEDLGLLGHISNQDMSERDPKAARESFEAFKELVQRFPESKYTPDARERMVYLVNALASNEIHIARYYLRRGAYMASSNRAQHVLKTYPEVKVQEDALGILAISYDKMNMPDLRDDTLKILRLNYPNSPYLNGSTGPQTPWWKLW